MNKGIIVSNNYTQKLNSFLTPLKNKKVLLIYGENSIKSYDIYNEISTILEQNSVKSVELGNIQPNPIYEEFIENVDTKASFELILAVGGGSVLDVAKFLKHKFYSNAEVISILTIIGSDSYKTDLVYFRSTKNRALVFNNICKPNKTLISPEITTSVPPNYTAYSSISIFTKAIFELINKTEVTVEDINKIITLIEEVLINPFDPEKREELIKWDVKLNNIPINIVSVLANVLTKCFNIPLGAALSIVTPAFLKAENLFEKLFNNKKFLFYNFSRFSDVQDNLRLEWWLHSLGSPIKFSEYNIEEDSYKTIAETTLKLCKDLGLKDVSEDQILNLLKLAT